MPSDPAGYILPGAMYTRQHFLAAMGLGLSTVRKWRRLGIELKTLPVAQQLLVKGSDGIAWLEAIAEQRQQVTETQ